MKYGLAIVSVCVCLAGCQGRQHENRQTVGDWQPPVAPQQPVAEVPSRKSVLALYQQAQAQSIDSRDLSARIATLQLKVAEERLAAGEDVDWQPVQQAISAVEPASDAAAITRARQLALVADMQGDREMLDQTLRSLVSLQPANLEARFRLAERQFSGGNYAGAALHYRAVAQEPGPYERHANYMLGWSLLKEADYPAAQHAYLRVLESLYANHSALSDAEAELRVDTERAFVLVTDGAGGPGTLQALFGSSNPTWEVAVYESLANSYREQSRYSDAIATLAAFTQQYPLHLSAASLDLVTIELLREAGFHTDAIAASEAFVVRYDRRSSYAARHDDEAFSAYADELDRYLTEWIARTHAGAQAASDPERFVVAADLYQRWLDNFVTRDKAADYRLLKAQALQDAGDNRAAIAAFASFVDHHPDHNAAADARYAIVVLSPEVPGGAIQIAAGKDFYHHHPTDPRAAGVQLKVANQQFLAGEFSDATLIADDLLAQPDAAILRAQALLVAGHAHFARFNYSPAQDRYRELLQIPEWPALDVTREDIHERYLAAMFKEGERLEQTGDLRGAIGQYARIDEYAPHSELAITTRYDVIALHESLGEHSIAAEKLIAYRDAYPERVDALPTSLRLVALLSVTDTAAATAELVSIAGNAAVDHEIRRTSMYRAAELARDDGNSAAAIRYFKRYAHTYNKPVAVRAEAMDSLDLLYQQTGEPAKRSFWLKKKAALLDTEDLSQRVYHLAGHAHYTLAEQARARFDKADIREPLKATLNTKQSHLLEATRHYQAAARSGVAGLAAASTFRIAALYEDIAAALMAAPRPDGLNPLEREQYDILLEEQAYPFEEQAIELHTVNLQRGWDGEWDKWVSQSQQSLPRYRRATFTAKN